MGQAYGFFEIPSVTAAVVAIDIMCKTAEVRFKLVAVSLIATQIIETCHNSPCLVKSIGNLHASH